MECFPLELLNYQNKDKQLSLQVKNGIMAVMSKILIIDDEPQLRGLLARIISLEGYDVLQAENCASGLKILQRETPDVVLCDVKLPDAN